MHQGGIGKMVRMKPCPFCGCEMKIEKGKYPNGDPKIVPRGFHNLDCILRAASFHTYPEEGWTEEKIAELWNQRSGEEYCDV